MTVSPPIKVLAFSPLYRPFLGGIEILLANILQPLRELGIDVAIVTESAEGLREREVMDGTRVYRLPLSAAVRSRMANEPLKVIRQLGIIIEEEQPNLVHMHSVAQAAAFYVDRLTVSSSALPIVATLHGALVEEDKLGVVLRLLGRAKALSGVSRACLASAAPYIRADLPQYLIYNGIPPARLSSQQWQEGETARLICVGRLQKEKGFDLAIRGLAHAMVRGFDGELSIIGRGGEEQQLMAIAASLGIGKRVRFLGEMPPVAVEREMAQSHVILAPSRQREGFGLVVAEAGRLGVPAIVAETGGLPEVVVHGETGFVLDRNSHEMVGDALLKLFSCDTNWRKLSVGVRNHVGQRFGLVDCIQGYAKFYRSISWN